MAKGMPAPPSRLRQIVGGLALVLGAAVATVLGIALGLWLGSAR